MIISTRGRYALRVMIDLSQQDPEYLHTAERDRSTSGDF